MKINKKCQERGVENRIEAPTPYPAATRPSKMQVQHPARNRKAEHELHDLAVRDGPLPLGSDPHRAEEVVSVHDHVHRRVGHERHREQRLSRTEPQITHDNNRGVVVHVEEGEPSDGTAEDDESRVAELEELGEVEDVGPEEEGPTGLHPLREADNAVEVGDGEDGERASDGHD